MSYILEALKKSQSDRELGQVPRVQGFGIDVPIEPRPPRPRPWAYAGLLLALFAVGASGLLLLRGLGVTAPENMGQDTTPASPAPARVDQYRHPAAADHLAGSANGARARAASPEPLAVGLPDAAAATTAPAPRAAVGALPAPQLPPLAVEPPPAPRPPPPVETNTRRSDAPTPTGPGATAGAAPAQPASAPGAVAGALPLTDPDNLSVEPKVLVVPAPAKPGEQLPRGAEELRRAALGVGGRGLASVDARDALPRPPPPGEPLPSAPPEHAPVPEDLLTDIEAFKELVRKEDPAAIKRAAAARPPLPEPPGLKLAPPDARPAVPPAPSLDLRNRLPPFSMSVHVYNPDPERRFVYINGRKLTESEQSREGIRLERVVTDGAVLSYQGEEFFQRR